MRLTFFKFVDPWRIKLNRVFECIFSGTKGSNSGMVTFDLGLLNAYCPSLLLYA